MLFTPNIGGNRKLSFSRQSRNKQQLRHDMNNDVTITEEINLMFRQFMKV